MTRKLFTVAVLGLLTSLSIFVTPGRSVVSANHTAQPALQSDNNQTQIELDEEEADDTDGEFWYEPQPERQGDVVTLRGNITQNTSLKANKRYVLEGGVFVKAPAKLKIKAGTQIFGGPNSFLAIERGAQILAKGKATKPIVFTSAQNAGSRKFGDWGGLIINGSAPMNIQNFQGEGGTGAAGGTNAADNSGVLQYVRVEFGGFPITPQNELNGIAFQGVGNGTLVDHVEVLESGDDSFEFFGGTVNVKHLLSLGNGDDAFDWVNGWVGKCQFLIALRDGTTEAQNGVEADNLNESNDVLPRSAPTIYNMTLIGDLETKSSSAFGMLLRVGTAGTFRNIIVKNFREFGIRVQNDSTLTQLQNGALSIDGLIIHGNTKGAFEFVANSGSPNPGDLSNLFRNVSTDDPKLTNISKTATPADFRPQTGSPALNQALVASRPQGDTFFEAANFLGGMGPNATDDWTKGWTTFVRK